MAIQHRRGAYTDFDPTKIVAAEIAVVLSDDPNVDDGKTIYCGVGNGEVKRLATDTDTLSQIYTEVDKAETELKSYVDSTWASATSAATNADNAASKVDAEISKLETAEAKRVSAENARVSAEKTRQSGYTSALNQFSTDTEAALSQFDTDSAAAIKKATDAANTANTAAANVDTVVNNAIATKVESSVEKAVANQAGFVWAKSPVTGGLRIYTNQS
jgi:hypothetical protein